MARRTELPTYSIHTYGAHFAEVGVDADTAEIRVRRMLGVFAAGSHPECEDCTLANDRRHDLRREPALLEEGIVDTRTGAFVNRDLAEYLVPVHADIPEIDADLPRRLRRQGQRAWRQGSR